MWRLTDNLDVYVGAVQHVLDLHGQRVLPRVAPLGRADEEDGVHFAGASPHRLVLQGNAIFLPGHHRAGLALPRRALLQKMKSEETFPSFLFIAKLQGTKKTLH